MLTSKDGKLVIIKGYSEIYCQKSALNMFLLCLQRNLKCKLLVNNLV